MTNFHLKTAYTLITVTLWIACSDLAQAQENPRDVVEKLAQAFETKCTQQYNETAIRNSIANLPDSERNLASITIDVRKYSECDCLPHKLRGISDESLNTMQTKGLKKSLQSMLEPMIWECVAIGFRDQWTPFCNELMIPETDDQRKIASVCQCMDREIEQKGNDALVQFSKSIFEKKSRAKGALEKSFESCMAKADIDPNSDYKKAYALARKEEKRIQLAKINMEMIASALSLYKLNNVSYPSQEQGLKSLLKKSEKPNKPNAFSGPYLKSLPKDPWGKEYIYNTTDQGKTYELLSHGRNGKPGGSGPDQDIIHPN